MAEVRVHFDTHRFGGNACGNYLLSGAELTADPEQVTCANCRRSKPWRKAAGIPEPVKPRPHRFRAQRGDSRADVTITGTAAAVDGMRDLLRRAGFEILSDLDGSDSPPVHQPFPTAGEVELFDLTAEDRVLDPGEFDVDRAVAVGQVDPLAVDQQPHAARVAHAFRESQ